MTITPIAYFILGIMCVYPTAWVLFTIIDVCRRR